jgi:hypothetical protein
MKKNILKIYVSLMNNNKENIWVPTIMFTVRRIKMK